MQWDWVIIDGYSLLHADDGLTRQRASNWDVARQLLVRKIEQAVGRWADKISVVFDGRDPGADFSGESHVLDIHYSPSRLTADTVIERMVINANERSRILVVTSDLAERIAVSANGGQTMCCREFIEQCAEHTAQRASAIRNPHRPSRRALGAIGAALDASKLNLEN